MKNTTAMPEPPPAETIRTFLELVDVLAAFEAQQRLIRGTGAFPENTTMPIYAAARVMAWLRDVADYQDKNELKEKKK